MLTIDHICKPSYGMMSNIHHERTEAAREQAANFRKQVIELNAKVTHTGLIVTLGAVLFENSKPELKRGAVSTLGKLAAFLKKYEDCNALIEGHTDNLGSEAFNFSLSLGRANSVKYYLASQGISPRRLATAGNGEGFPIASNDSASGRLLNQRVEVIISNPSSLEK